MQSGGSRSYILRIPDNYDNARPYRLIFAYPLARRHHGGCRRRRGERGRLVVLRAEGAGGRQHHLRCSAGHRQRLAQFRWPGSDVHGRHGRAHSRRFCVDTTRVFALGFSYGGGMSYALACGRPTVFRAVAVYSGGVLSGCEGGTQPVAYLGIHGLGDNVLGTSGGRSMRDRFVMNNGCTDQEPARAEPRQPDAHVHDLPRLHGRISCQMVRVRRWSHDRAWWTAAVTTAPGPGPRPRPGSSSRSSSSRTSERSKPREAWGFAAAKNLLGMSENTAAICTALAVSSSTSAQPCPAIRPRREADIAAEQASELTLISEAALECDLRQRLAGCDQMTRAFDALPQHVLIR